jgi:hypothetical protein
LIVNITTQKPHRWCLHLIVVVGFECSRDPGSYAGGSVATGRSHPCRTGQWVGDRRRGVYLSPPSWGLNVRLTTSHRKN